MTQRIFVTLDPDSGVTPAQVRIMIAAARYSMKQLAHVYNKYPITFVSARSAKAGDIELLITRDADAAGALGYHDTKADGTAYIRVFTGDILSNGGTVLGDSGNAALSVIVCFLHEVLETWFDEDCVSWWTWGKRSVAAELCDPVQNDVRMWNGVALSNAILPAWWTPGKQGPYDWFGVLSKPFTVSKGGYAIVATASNVGQVFGDKNGILKPSAKMPKSATRFMLKAGPVAAVKQMAKTSPVSRTYRRLQTLPDAA